MITMRARTETVKRLTDYYAAMEANRPHEFGSYYAEHMTLTFGNSPEIKGRENVTSAFREVLDRVASLGHDLVNAWEEDGGVVFFESIGRWTLHCGTVIEVKAASKITIVGGKFVDQRIYVDNAPVFEALGRENASPSAGSTLKTATHQ
ncbi:nuclear transport factor 2 family protein [Streptomyces sp. NPDC047046]|uniref:nuclear transport factor 2 family protein n=1 Tax=Streptomyces sp. NPDC047046 TaxID=3155378 RepID=UPI0033C1B94F